jgi:hypothetical protein
LLPDFVASLPLAIVVVAGVCAPLSGWLAMQRARNPVVWFVYGALIGPLAPLLLVAAPMGSCPRCGRRSVGWSAQCVECGARLGGVFDESSDTPPARPSPAAPAARVRESVGVATPPAPSSPARTPASTAATVPTPPAPVAPWANGGVASMRARVPGSAPGLAPGQDLTTSGASTGQVLATAVYLSGNAGLEIGACYAIARVDDRIRVFGPVDTGQLTVRHERPIDEGEVVALDDRLIITLHRGRSTTSMIMRWVGGMVPSAVETALAHGSPEGRSTGGMPQ